MATYTYSFEKGVGNPKKLCDIGPRAGVLVIQVLDNSIFFFGTDRDTMLQKSGPGSALQQGFQQILSDRQKQYLLKGEIWVVCNTDGGVLDFTVIRDIFAGALGGIVGGPGVADVGEQCQECPSY